MRIKLDLVVAQMKDLDIDSFSVSRFWRNNGIVHVPSRGHPDSPLQFDLEQEIELCFDGTCTLIDTEGKTHSVIFFKRMPMSPSDFA